MCHHQSVFHQSRSVKNCGINLTNNAGADAIQDPD